MSTPSPHAPPSAPAATYPLLRACGWTTVALALFLLATIHAPPARAGAGTSVAAYVGANSATCFLLCGAALLLARRDGWPARAATAAGLAVAALALAYWTAPLHGWHAASLAAQHVLNARPGHVAAPLWPGRMRDGGATAFLIAGVALALLPHARGRWRAAVPVLGIGLVLLSLPSLLAAMVGSALVAARGAPGGMLMSVPAACGMTAVGLGLAGSAERDAWPRTLLAREDRQIFFTSLLLFALLSLAAGVAGVAIVGRHAMRQVQEAWRDSFQSNRQLFIVSLESAERRSRDIGSYSGLDGLLRGPADLPGLQRAAERVARLAGLDATDSLTIVDAADAVLAATGTARPGGRLAVALPLPLTPRLYWDGEWRLSTTVPLARGARARVDVALAEFNRRYRPLNPAGATREIRVCGAAGGWIDCFPSRLQPAPTRFPLASAAAPTPTRLALAGEEGVGIGTDYRERVVLAAYGRLGDTGLAFVQKIDADEFYEPLRRKLWLALAGIALLILAGAALLWWRTQPLVRRLVRTRARLDATLGNLPAGVFTFDDAGIVRSVNRAGAAMFGYAPEDLAHAAIDALLPGCTACAIDAPGQARQLAARDRAGRELTLEVVANAFVLGGGRRGIAIVHDVGERVRIECALRQREASLAHAQQLAHVGSWELNLLSGAYFWSDETYRMFGLRPGGPPPDREGLLGMVHPDDRAAKCRAAAQACLGDGAYDVVYRAMRPDGAIRVIHARAEVETDAGGRPVRMRGTVQDITDKTWADEQLRKREEEYRALVENSPDVVARFDGDLRCLYVNQACAACPGLRDVLVAGRALDAGPAAAPWHDAVRAAFADGGRRTFETVGRDGGGERHFQVQVVAERHRDGKVATVLATARDITAIRAGEHRLRRLTAHLERVREEERKHIAREVHDELGQALTALRMDVGLLRLADGAASPALLARIAAMKDAVDRTIGIVRQVTTALRPAALDLGLTAALEWLTEDVARRSGIDCWLRAGAEVELDDGRATVLFRIAQESLTNVLRHAGAGAVEVTLDARDGHVLLEVVDDGRGFDPDTVVQPGRFGLMGMRERVLMHGGDFDIRSGPDGTRVRVRLPLAPLATS